MFQKVSEATLEKFVAILFVAVLLTMLATLYTAALFPIYPDEIAVRFGLSRLFTDYPLRISGLPFCGGGYQEVRPSMLLPALWHTVLYGGIDNVVTLRLTGVLIGLLLMLSAMYYLASAQGSEKPRPLFAAGVIASLLSLGVFPIFLVTNRNEQIILIGLLLLLMSILTTRQPYWHTPWLKALRYFLLISAGSLILTAHPKGLFLLPALLVATGLFHHGRHATAKLIATSFVLLWIAFDAYAFFKGAYQCEELPHFNEYMRQMSLDTGKLLSAPGGFVIDVVRSLANLPQYLINLGFTPRSGIDYLPPAPLSLAAHSVNALVFAAVSVVFVAIQLLVPFRYFRTCLLLGRRLNINLLLVSLLLALWVSMAFNIPKNWYDSGYVFALTIIILLVYVRENAPQILWSRQGLWGCAVLALISLASQAVLIGRNLPPFQAGYEGPGISLIRHDQALVDAQLAKLEKQCGIDPDRSQRLIIDDYTYFRYQNSQWPMAITYINLAMNSDRHRRQFISRSNSDGLITRCNYLRPQDRHLAFRDGLFCCISKEDLYNFSKSFHK